MTVELFRVTEVFTVCLLFLIYRAEDIRTRTLSDSSWGQDCMGILGIWVTGVIKSLTPTPFYSASALLAMQSTVLVKDVERHHNPYQNFRCVIPPNSIKSKFTHTHFIFLHYVYIV